MSRLVAILMLTVAVAAARPALAGRHYGKVACACGSLKASYYDVKLWPAMYVPIDRVAVQTAFAMEIANGWRVQNTLSEFHFNETTGELNEFGRLKVHDILTYTPIEYRSLFVLKADEQSMTSARLKSTHEVATQYLPHGSAVDIFETAIRPRTSAGAYVDVVERAFTDSTPAPRLPASAEENEASGN